MAPGGAPLPDIPIGEWHNSKRRRTALACNACRTRKSRCDGQRPTCSACQSLDFECHYEPSESSTNVIVRKEYMSDLEHRMTSVERLLQRHDDLLKGHLSTCVSHAAPISTKTIERQAAPAHVTRNEETLGLQASALEEPANEDPKTDGLAMTFVDERTSAFFGESSNINFTRLVLRLTAAMHKSSPVVQGGGEKELPLVQATWAALSKAPDPWVEKYPASTQASIKTLPSTEDMDNMLDIYFSSTGLLFPFIHEATMRKTYHECKNSGFTRVRRTWLGILNMIFAMATNCNQNGMTLAKTRLESSYLFYRRATELCGELSKHIISLEVVHYLLLVVLYCQGTQQSVQAWSFHGLLVRSAMALGLHVGRADDPPDGCRQESGCRTWLTTYCLDKVLSMTFGRPAAIPEEYMVARSPAPWPSPASPYVSDSSDDLPREFLSVSVGLYGIMGRSLVKQYGANVGGNDSEVDETSRLQASAELRGLLRRWVTGLPLRLQICEPGAQELFEQTQVHRLRVILTLRYLNVSILIHRPLLSTTLRHLFEGETSCLPGPVYHVQLAMAEAQECVRAAENTIDIVHSILTADYSVSSNLGVWFFTLYYVFTASLIISARLLWAQSETSTTVEGIASHYQLFLEKADVVFHKLDHGNGLTLSCARYIRYLSELREAKGHKETQAYSALPSLISASTESCSDGQSAAVPMTSDITSRMGQTVDTLGLFPAEYFDPSVFQSFATNVGYPDFPTFSQAR